MCSGHEAPQEDRHDQCPQTPLPGQAQEAQQGMVKEEYVKDKEEQDKNTDDQVNDKGKKVRVSNKQKNTEQRMKIWNSNIYLISQWFPVH